MLGIRYENDVFLLSYMYLFENVCVYIYIYICLYTQTICNIYIYTCLSNMDVSENET